MDQLVEAIVRLAVRGAPLLGVAGALGVALAVGQAEREGWDAGRLDAEVKRIADARPTAVNLRREVLAVAAVIPGGAGAVQAAALGRPRHRDRDQQAAERARGRASSSRSAARAR